MAAVQHIPQDVRASIWFLKDSEAYTTVKPYTLAFNPASGIPRDNIQREEVSITISDLRNVEKRFSVDENGFTLLRFDSEFGHVNWDDYQEVKELHWPWIIAQVKHLYPDAKCAVLHHQVRKRHSVFPQSTGSDYTYGQPLLAAHVDMVRSSAEQMIQERLGPDKARDILRSKYILANVWHVLRGPNQDWPLALCDVTTVDPKQDLEVADYITEETNREHCLVYHRDAHRWWYMSNQETTEALFFRQYDGAKGTTSGVPHAAFQNRNYTNTNPRESIEVVVAIYWPQYPVEPERSAQTRWDEEST